MGYGCGDSFPLDFETNGIPFGSENLKENCHHDHIPFNVKGNGNIVFSVRIGAARVLFFFILDVVLNMRVKKILLEKRIQSWNTWK